MKYILGILAMCFSISCGDGDLQVETLDFDGVNIQFCESSATVSSTLFFKLNSDEALILELQSGLLKNEVSAAVISSAVPGQSEITYRLFSGTISKNYFCDDIPPSTPTVIQELEAVSGEILITTVQSETDSTAFEHTIELSGISLLNENGERITDLSINDFGSITTK